MSDFRTSRARRYRDLDKPAYGTGYQPAAATNNWGWIAAALCMAVILVITLAGGHEPNRIAANDLPPAAAGAPGLGSRAPAATAQAPAP